VRWHLLALVMLATAFFAERAGAQCASNASSCVSCHEAQGLRSVLGGGAPWHSDHGFGDLCTGCHHGEPTAREKAAAHVGRTLVPVDDVAGSCASCHHERAAALAARYRAAPKSAPTAPATPGARAATERRGPSVGDAVLGALSAALAVALFVLARRTIPPDEGLGAWLRAASRGSVAAGALLGVVVAVSEVGYGRPVAAAGAFDKLAAYPGRALLRDSMYYAHIMPPAITLQIWSMVGLLGGAFVSALAQGEVRARWLPESGWAPRFGASRVVRFGVAFVGAALVQIGAGIAGGCTSGLAISGGAALAPAAFVFMAGMFMGGIPAAWAWHRGRREP
jgi:uncharacterized membrane protein YedE/YeeE